MTDPRAPRNGRLDSAEGLEPRIHEILSFVLALAEGSELPALEPAGKADAIDAITVALNMLAQTFDAEKRKRVLAEELLRDEREAYDEAADLLCSVSPQGELLKVNGTFAEAAHAPPTALLGKPLASLFAERSRPELQRSLDALLQGAPAPHVDLEFVAATRPQQVRLHGRVTRDPAGQATRLRLAFRDVTSERQLESRLLVAQQLEALGRLAGGVAHDFNNLLLVMRNTVSLLAVRIDGGKDDLAAFFEAADAAASITRQMLTFARRDVVQPADVEVKSTVERTLPILVRLAGPSIALDCSLDEVAGLHVPLDEARLQQLLVNLIINARDAMPDGGEVRVSARRGQSADGATVSLLVDDGGPGIPPELRHAVFEPFFTTKAVGKGTGLGLATVHGIVAKVGGHIDVQASPLGGARFVLELPVVQRTAGPPSSSPAQPSHAGAPSSAIVLVLEDDDLVRPLTCRILRGAGYRVLEAADGAAALAHAAQTELHLVVADVILVGETGPEVVEALRAVQPRIAALFVSGYTRDALDGPLGQRAFLQKPFTPDDLLALVRQALGEPRQREA